MIEVGQPALSSMLESRWSPPIGAELPCLAPPDQGVQRRLNSVFYFWHMLLTGIIAIQHGARPQATGADCKRTGPSQAVPKQLYRHDRHNDHVNRC